MSRVIPKRLAVACAFELSIWSSSQRHSSLDHSVSKFSLRKSSSLNSLYVGGRRAYAPWPLRLYVVDANKRIEWIAEPKDGAFIHALQELTQLLDRG